MNCLKSSLTLLSFCLFTLSACEDNSGEPPDVKADIEVETEILAEFIDDDIEKIVLSQLFNFTLTRGVAAGTQTHELNNPYEFRTRCATKQTLNNKTQVIIDYGSGCRDILGRFRAGRITADLYERTGNVFGRIEVTLDNYQYESVLVTGERTTINNKSTHRQYAETETIIPNGILTFNDLSNYAYSSNRTTVWDFTSESETEFNFTTTFRKTGTNRNGQNFESASFPEVLTNSRCFESGTGQITGGSLRIDQSDNIKSVDFTSLNCSMLVSVNLNGNESYNLELSTLFINL